MAESNGQAEAQSGPAQGAPARNGRAGARALRGWEAEALPAGPYPPGARPEVTPWTANLQIQRLLLIGMFACAAWALSRMLVAVGLTEAHALAIFLVATAIWAAGLALGGRGEGKNYRRYTDYDISDWVLLLVPIVLLLKLLPRLLEGPAAIGAEIASWPSRPGQFFDATLVWSLLLVVLVWDSGLRVGEDVINLSLQPDEIAPPANSPAYHDWLSSPYRFVDHTGAWRRLMWRFVLGGLALMIFTGLTLVRPEQIGDADRPEIHGVIPHVLLYYLLGLILASQSSLDRLRTAWLRSGSAIQPGLARRWLGYGVALVAISLLVALILPTSFSAQTSDQLPIIWRWLWFLYVPAGLLFGAVEWVIRGIAALLFLPLAWLLPQGVPVRSDAVAQPVPTPVPVEPASDAPFPSLTSRIVWSLLLYVVPTALAAYALWNTWQKRRAIWGGLRSFGRDAARLLWGGLLDLLAALWRFFSLGSPRLLDLAPAAIRERLRKRRLPGPASPGAMGWLRLRGLGPRELIQYFYVSLAQRAEVVGWGRSKGQTPYEYSRQLAERLPDRRGELDSLTEAFVRARYSRRPVSEADARRARGPWQRLRGSLQTRRRAQQVSGWFGFGKDKD